MFCNIFMNIQCVFNIVRRLTALCISFNHTYPDPNLRSLKNQGKIFQLSTAPDQLPYMSRAHVQDLFEILEYWNYFCN